MSTNKPRVSIGLPVYNGENYLAESLDALLAQTFTNFELLIADNASTDRTQEICLAYADKDHRIRYFRHGENLGAAENYNFVFNLASGEYFKWAAHDDLLAPEYLGRCVEVLDRKPEVILCYPRTMIIDEHGQFVRNYVDGYHFRSPRASDRFREFFHVHGLCNPVFGLIRANILQRTARIGNYASSDRVLLGELALHGQFYEIPEYLFLRRGHPESSLSANITDNDIAAWFDPNRESKLLLPRWRRLSEYLKAIGRTQLSWPEKVRCYGQIGRFALALGKWSKLIAELFKVISFVPRLLRHKAKLKNT